METAYIENKTFDKTNELSLPLPKGEYENCTFIGCDLSHAELSGIHFSECVFTDCNLSMAKLFSTSFRDVRFKGCKLMGLPFANCSQLLFSVNFDNCVLNFSSFYRVNCKKTIFRNTNLTEVDFVETDLAEAIFDQCDLTHAIFENTILEKADLRTSHGYSINPEINRIKKARFSLSGIAGLLDKYGIIIE